MTQTGFLYWPSNKSLMTASPVAEPEAPAPTELQAAPQPAEPVAEQPPTEQVAKFPAEQSGD